jgi:hypothetical protein
VSRSRQESLDHLAMAWGELSGHGRPFQDLWRGQSTMTALVLSALSLQARITRRP